MILFDPITSERKKVGYSELIGLTGKTTNEINEILDNDKRKIKGCYLLSEPVQKAKLRELMEKATPDDEEWRIIPNTNTECSNYGRFRSRRHIMKQMCILNEQAKITLYTNCIINFHMAYKVVASIWLDKPYEDYDISVIDGNRFNCRLSNLEYVENHVAKVRAWKSLGKSVIQKIDINTGNIDDEYIGAEIAADLNFTSERKIRSAILSGEPIKGYIYKRSEGRR